MMFAIYHFAVYGSIDVLLVVLGSGIVLSYAVLRTRRLSPTVLAHVINNFIATG
jgi:membrane protease YdiL (CAAX protease family)